ncbi:hypothetical protein C2845_PM10G02530 [Panicum miliaceum]|uniref:Uncharacterized protein n=1 Tax=Panicum miliaceum TaxID=4540 RepID=A0A3L6PGG2_PANMI|nr:hypothetical protein C2845_PM10G02530 [Panicum miliaceum]
MGEAGRCGCCCAHGGRGTAPRRAREGALARQRRGERLPRSGAGGRRERSARPRWQVLSRSSRIRQFCAGRIANRRWRGGGAYADVVVRRFSSEVVEDVTRCVQICPLPLFFSIIISCCLCIPAGCRQLSSGFCWAGGCSRDTIAGYFAYAETTLLLF